MKEVDKSNSKLEPYNSLAVRLEPVSTNFLKVSPQTILFLDSLINPSLLPYNLAISGEALFTLLDPVFSLNRSAFQVPTKSTLDFKTF